MKVDTKKIKKLEGKIKMYEARLKEKSLGYGEVVRTRYEIHMKIN